MCLPPSRSPASSRQALCLSHRRRIVSVIEISRACLAHLPDALAEGSTYREQRGCLSESQRGTAHAGIARKSPRMAQIRPGMVRMRKLRLAHLMQPSDRSALPRPSERFEVGVDVRAEQVAQLMVDGFEIGRRIQQ
jgi:hypothetical protein